MRYWALTLVGVAIFAVGVLAGGESTEGELAPSDDDQPAPPRARNTEDRFAESAAEIAADPADASAIGAVLRLMARCEVVVVGEVREIHYDSVATPIGSATRRTIALTVASQLRGDPSPPEIAVSGQMPGREDVEVGRSYIFMLKRTGDSFVSYAQPMLVTSDTIEVGSSSITLEVITNASMGGTR